MSQPKPKEEPIKILIVDDDKNILKALKSLLSNYGYDVETSENADDAINKLQNEQFALVLTDVYMPGTDGLQLLKEVQVIQPSARTIVMTGYSSTDTIKVAFECKASGFLMKPFKSGQQVIAKVERALVLNGLYT